MEGETSGGDIGLAEKGRSDRNSEPLSGVTTVKQNSSGRWVSSSTRFCEVHEASERGLSVGRLIREGLRQVLLNICDALLVDRCFRRIGGVISAPRRFE
jgi:hypothetical protein